MILTLVSSSARIQVSSFLFNELMAYFISSNYDSESGSTPLLEGAYYFGTIFHQLSKVGIMENRDYTCKPEFHCKPLKAVTQ